MLTDNLSGGVFSLVSANATLVDPCYLLGICNSSVFWAFVKHKMPTMGIGRHAIRLERLRQFPIVLPSPENQSLVQSIVTSVRSLLADSPSLPECKRVMAEIDHLVCRLYGLEDPGDTDQVENP